MQILKKYFDEDDWFEISEEEARRTLGGFYSKVEPVLQEISNGFTVYTAVAEFKRAEAREEAR